MQNGRELLRMQSESTLQSIHFGAMQTDGKVQFESVEQGAQEKIY
jgi:hypothetical protein